MNQKHFNATLIVITIKEIIHMNIYINVGMYINIENVFTKLKI